MNREELLQANGRCVEKVEIKGIGDVHVAVLNARSALALEGAIQVLYKEGKFAEMLATQLAAFVCDESGKPILTYDDATQIIDQWSANQARDLVRAGQRLNGLGGDSVENAGGN